MQTSIFSGIKKIIVTTCCAFSVLSVQAQTFSILPANTQTVTLNCDSAMRENKIYISNPNSNPLDLSYTILSNTLPIKGCWYYQFCDWFICTVNIPATNSTKRPPILIPANSTNSTMALDIITLTTKGGGILSIKLFETNNPSNSQIITWHVTGCSLGNECAIGIKESSLENSIAVYPNPGINTITVDTKNIENVKTLDVYNLIGKNIIHQDVNEPDNSTLNISKLEKGIYLLEIRTKNNVVVTKKFIKN